MKSVVYKVDNKYFPSQRLLAEYLNVNYSTLKYWISKQGGVNNNNSIIIKDIQIELIKSENAGTFAS